MELLAGRFSKDIDNAFLLEQFDSFEALAVRWDIEDYGLSRLEITVNRKDSNSAYDSYVTHNGFRFGLYSKDLSYPISGFITETKWLNTTKIKYIVKGPFVYLFGQYIRKFYPPSTTITQTLIDFLSSYIFIDDDDITNIFNNTSILNGWTPEQPEGVPPYKAIKELLKLSTANYDITDFWFRDNPFPYHTLDKYKAFYQKRNGPNDDIVPDWIVYREDLEGLELSRSINELRTTSRIYYGALTGTITAFTATTITDSGATFITDGVYPGAKITNTTNGGSTKILNVNSQTQLTIAPWKAKYTGTCTGGSFTTLQDINVDFTTLGVAINDTVHNLLDDSTGTVSIIATNQLTHSAMTSGKQNDEGERYEILGAIAVNDSYVIEVPDSDNFVEASLLPVEDWTVEHVDFFKGADSTIATQIANNNLNGLSSAISPFTIRSENIIGPNLAQWPILEIIARGGGTIKIADLYPDNLNRPDSESTFFITALDYDFQSRQMRVNLDTLDRRLDVRLKQNLILDSTIISRRRRRN